MATERRLIDANALIAEYDRVHIGPPGGARKLMEDAPTIDAVPVVRCKNCKHYMLWEDSEDKKTCAKSIGLMVSDPDDFCSYGEKREM